MYVSRIHDSTLFDQNLMFKSYVSGSSYSPTPNAYLQNVQNSAKKCVFQKRQPGLIQLLFILCVFWVLSAMLLVSVERGYQHDPEKVEHDWKTRRQFMAAFWKLNQTAELDSKKWNETVESLIDCFLAFLFMANTVGNVPGHSNTVLSPGGRLLLILTATPSIVLFYHSLWTLSNLINDLKKRVQQGLLLALICSFFVFLWIKHQFYPKHLELPTVFEALFMLFNVRATSSNADPWTILTVHTLFWICLLAGVQKVDRFKKELYLKIVDGLDDETALLVMLPELRLDRSEHLIHRYSQRSCLHRLAALLLTERDKCRIADVIDQFQLHGSSSDLFVDGIDARYDHFVHVDSPL